MTPFERHIAKAKAAAAEGALYCENCGGVLFYEHDHRPDGSGLDDGPYLPGRAPRKKAAPKPADEIADIRARAWATRRAKYGPRGHR